MLIRAAERCFQRGIEALARGEAVEALALFEAAIELERRHGVSPPQPRYLSFYGLCLGLETHRLREGIRLCREALSVEFYNPDLSWNLGRLLLEAGRRREAHETLSKGLTLQPHHAGIRHELERMGHRRRPMLRFLSRRHPFNVLLGKLRGASGPSGPSAPVTGLAEER